MSSSLSLISLVRQVTVVPANAGHLNEASERLRDGRASAKQTLRDERVISVPPRRSCENCLFNGRLRAVLPDRSTAENGSTTPPSHRAPLNDAAMRELQSTSGHG